MSNQITKKQLRQLKDLQKGLDHILTDSEFMIIVRVYEKVIERELKEIEEIQEAIEEE